MARKAPHRADVGLIIDYLASELDITLCGLLHFLLETMQNIDRLRSRRQIDDTENTGNVLDADFPAAGADGCQRFPVTRFDPALHQKQLMPHVVDDRGGESLQVRFAAAHPDDRLHGNMSMLDYA